MATTLSRLTPNDLYLFNEGTHIRLYDKLGAHPTVVDGVAGVDFAVWAPNARGVSVVGSFNGWNPEHDWLESLGNAGIWEGFIPGVGLGELYKFHIVGPNGQTIEKADPFAFQAELPPATASVVCGLNYDWSDAEWMAGRGRRLAADAPVAIYEVHIGSWMRVPEEGNRSLSYRELAPKLAEYVTRLGFTHVEFLPIMEHPFFGSWGYQITGFFAPDSRYGTPQDFMYLIDYLHQHGIGVILDWVPSHFPVDVHGLASFDGTHLFEHANPMQGFHPDWNSLIFNYGRHEVQAFLLSSIIFWLDRYHVDGIRVDAVASMLYLDYSRQPGEWIPNKYGGRENLEAIAFLRTMNEVVYREFPDVQTIAEESTAWPMVSRPTYVGGLGFGMKWDMGWMHDTLSYFSQDPIHRSYHHNRLTFRMIYAFNENFVLPLSHDEVVHGKGSLIGKLPGDDWQKFANLRLLFAYMWAQPGKKLLFMGDEFGQWSEWNHDGQLQWDLLQYPAHQGIERWLADLNRAYHVEPALHRYDFDWAGFQWLDANDAPNSVLSFFRLSDKPEDRLLCVFNMTPVPRYHYRVGVPLLGRWRELLNSDAEFYGGSGVGNFGGVDTTPIPSHGQPRSILLTLPPLAALFFKHVPAEPPWEAATASPDDA
ncbi:MAG TPA: 1,4-alpha-glucan branching protein GlgB [Nitrolancea sp.]|nr:1,4-alpha-glucan branching protein GlgB [Nitrolancea sp.]